MEIWVKIILMFNNVGRRLQTHNITNLAMQQHKKARIFLNIKIRFCFKKSYGV
jgi:hypothetical protein